ncbi:P-loop containing nucleoside triphosphate hydrolase protein [Dactylonectria estremocensis]|uniref:P-loop containing nucleoside triphosphate hydrolase protein n=1 Tax=Dactylonectria estremocensis TaxID=1079267 RepID=A0A9P9F2K4_9HYPO|nr:P-loop containing nucleoside triphosphate hydrolase protein [Dactylonectria estremocensis]
MLPTRLSPLRLGYTLSLRASIRLNALFSTSVPVSRRIRPGLRGSLQRTPKPELSRDLDDANTTAGADIQKQELKGTPEIRHQHDGPSPQKIQVDESDMKKPATKTKPFKLVVPRGLKPHQQSLFQHESICYKPDATSPEATGKIDRPPLAAAAKFFEEKCRLLYSAETLHHHPQNDHVPEIVVLGASNAGKSSFLNALVGKMDTARVSHRPGKTTTMNAYGVGPRPKIARDLVRKGSMPPKHSLILMDTPGYGFKSRSDWGKTILQYLNVRQTLRGAVILLPADKKLQDTDRWMLKTLAQSNTRTLVVLTKADKTGDEWVAVCNSLATGVRQAMIDLDTTAQGSWREGCDRSGDVYATAANMGISNRLGNGAGLGGVRLAILEMAGFALGERVEKQPETKAYTGAIVSFDDIKWKT